jgi:hypothetical protein
MVRQTLSRGFHRLGLFLAAIPLLVGGSLSLAIALDAANSAKEMQAKLVCAQTALKNTPAPSPDYGAMIDAAQAEGQDETPEPPKSLKLLSDEEVGLGAPPAVPTSKNPDVPPGYHLDTEQIDLQKLGCSEWTQTTTVSEVYKPPESYAASFLPPLGLGLAITLAVSLAFYGLVRAIGWVIGGFVAS